MTRKFPIRLVPVRDSRGSRAMRGEVELDGRWSELNEFLKFNRSTAVDLLPPDENGVLAGEVEIEEEEEEGQSAGITPHLL